MTATSFPSLETNRAREFWDGIQGIGLVILLVLALPPMAFWDFLMFRVAKRPPVHNADPPLSQDSIELVNRVSAERLAATARASGLTVAEIAESCEQFTKRPTTPAAVEAWMRGEKRPEMIEFAALGTLFKKRSAWLAGFPPI